MAIHTAAAPVAGKDVAVVEGQGALAVELVPFELTSIGRAVSAAPLAFTVAFAVVPVALITAAIGIPGLAVAMELAVDKVTFVAETSIVLPGAVAGSHVANPFAVAVINRGVGFQAANQRHFLAGGQGNSVGPGLVAGLFDGDVIAAGLEFQL